MEMSDQSVMPHSLWSGLVNYIKASAQNAEALQPWPYTKDKEEMTVLVFTTSIQGFDEQSLVFDQLNDLLGSNNWTIDLDDVDKVLRVVGLYSNMEKIIRILNGHQFSCKVMN
jgi:hypothetical protein